MMVVAAKIIAWANSIAVSVPSRSRTARKSATVASQPSCCSGNSITSPMAPCHDSTGEGLSHESEDIRQERFTSLCLSTEKQCRRLPHSLQAVSRPGTALHKPAAKRMGPLTQSHSLREYRCPLPQGEERTADD